MTPETVVVRCSLYSWCTPSAACTHGVLQAQMRQGHAHAFYKFLPPPRLLGDVVKLQLRGRCQRFCCYIREEILSGNESVRVRMDGKGSCSLFQVWYVIAAGSYSQVCSTFHLTLAMGSLSWVRYIIGAGNDSQICSMFHSTLAVCRWILAWKLRTRHSANCQPYRAVLFCSAAFAALFSLGLILAWAVQEVFSGEVLNNKSSLPTASRASVCLAVKEHLMDAFLGLFCRGLGQNKRKVGKSVF